MADVDSFTGFGFCLTLYHDYLQNMTTQILYCKNVQPEILGNKKQTSPWQVTRMGSGKRSNDVTTRQERKFET